MAQLLRLVRASIVLLALTTFCTSQQLYITNEPLKTILKLDVATGEQTVLYNTPEEPDSLILNSAGQIIYDLDSAGELGLFDPSTGNNTILLTGLKGPRDLVMEPGGTTMLIALYTVGKIARYNFISGTLSTLPTKLGSTVDGLAYDPAGDLFAVVSHNTVCQIDPATGAILKTLVLEPHYKVNGGDGMTYDPYTGQLWVSHDGTLGHGLIEIPTNLSTFTLYQTGRIHAPDGIVSDGKGNLYVGAIWTMVVYNISTNTITHSFIVKGADDVALIPGTF